MPLAAHKKFLVNVIHAEEDGVLYTINGILNIRKGDIILHNQLGEPDVISRDYYEQNYIEVEKVNKRSLFAEAYAQASSKFSLDNQFEDIDYIEGTRRINNL